MRLTKWIYLCSVCLFIWGCSADEEAAVFHEMDPEIEVYFVSFEYEANQRGVDINIEDEQLVGYFTEIEEDIVGQCAKLTDGSKEVRIDLDYWNKSNELEREFLIFHELGHCILNRSHTDDSDESGTCLSMMNSGLGNCRNLYRNTNRAEMLDELFDQ